MKTAASGPLRWGLRPTKRDARERGGRRRGSFMAGVASWKRHGATVSSA
jgi:hypothetical protein